MTSAQHLGTLIYREVVEDQDMIMDGELVKIHNPYNNEAVYIKRLSRQVVGDEDGQEFNRPLSVGMKWGQDAWRTDNMYCYYVEKKEDVTVPAGTFKSCFKIVNLTCPDDSTWWYYPGLGVVKYEYHHHGTITNILRELIAR
jgi:hypothetical protein